MVQLLVGHKDVKKTFSTNDISHPLLGMMMELHTTGKNALISVWDLIRRMTQTGRNTSGVSLCPQILRKNLSCEIRNKTQQT